MAAGQMNRHSMDGVSGTTSRMIDRYALAHDASHYLLIPQLVSKPGSWDEVAAQLKAAAESGHAITFRSGGTSLSGQASAGDILMDTRSGFRTIEVLDDGRQVRVEPGAVLRAVNARLAPYGRKLGPDPASEVACTVGGVVANNSSGMHCGTSQNSYQTVASMVFILASGTMIDSAHPDADNRLRELEPALYEGLCFIRDELRSRPEHVARIRRQFTMKNTMGYGINSFLDFQRPVDILVHLLIGSEGTLAFIAQVTFNTVPLLRNAAAGLLIFDSLKDANTSLEALLAGKAKTLELLDAESLRVAQNQLRSSKDPAVAALQALEVRHHAALLVEAAEASPEDLAQSSASLNHVISGLPLNCGRNGAAQLSGNTASRTLLWKMRKGLYTSVAAARPPGTVALLEDIAVPLPALADTCESLTTLFSKYDYRNSVIFGHAKDGNVHFLLNEDFDGQGTRRYEDFTLDLVDLVLGADGTLKAEHGTGRVMAPFVRRQYGNELFAIMQRVKKLIDPLNVLNPGVLLNDDPQSYLKNIKPVPVVDDEINSCVECGYCEPACPSRNVTLTPRQRIVVRREIQGALNAGNAGLAASLQADYVYEAVETCAADGMCSVACPVLIDTGKLMKRIRAETVGAAESKVASGLAGRWSAVAQGARLALTAAHAAPAAIPTGATKAGRKLLGEDRIPQWSGDVPRPGPARRGLRRHHSSGSDAEFIYLPACINEIFGAADSGKRGVSNAFLALCERAGVKVHIPENISSLCCGTPMSSKGYVAAADRMRSDVEGSILELCERLFSDHQQILLVSDASSCSHSFKEIFTAKTGDYRDRIIVQDAVTFTRNHLLPLLPEAHKINSLTLHPTCSTEHLGIMGDLTAVAAAISNDVLVPADWGCCGFAGDRGMLHPELTASATREESAEVRGHPTEEYASCNRTCEIGLSRATGQEYSHLLELLERQTR